MSALAGRRRDGGATLSYTSGLQPATHSHLLLLSTGQFGSIFAVAKGFINGEKDLNMGKMDIGAAAAGPVLLRVLWGGAGHIDKTETREMPLERNEDGRFRLTIPKGMLPVDAWALEVVAPFFKARKGDEGWWMQGRGLYGLFDKDDGKYVEDALHTPLMAVRRNGTLWSAEVVSWRFDYDFVARACKGEYEIFPRFRLAAVREFFPYYQDIVIDFTHHEGTGADYNDIARDYRARRLAKGEIRTIRDRERDFPELSYLSEAIVVRIQTHAAKPIPESADGIEQKFFKAGEELPVVVHMPFGVTEEFLQALHDAGVDKLSICSAGWQDGGYDGRVPGHFPVGAEAGGEEAYRRLIDKAHELGYQFSLHATNTDGYSCSRMWSEDWIAKKADGSHTYGGIWAGGQCFWVCQEKAWKSWLPDEMRQMAGLGVRGPHYIDVYSATYPKPCADPRHPCTPERTAEIQNEVLAYAKKLVGGAASEAGFDHVAGNIDYINYVGRHIQEMRDGLVTLQDGERRGAAPYALATGVFPLWELVYHGVILYTSDRICQNHTRGKCRYKLEKSGDPRWMEGDGIEDPYAALKIIEFGGRPVFYTFKFADVPRIKKAWDEFLPVRHLQREEMVSHRELEAGVFETRYGDGSRTVCNYNNGPRAIDGAEVPPMGYILFSRDGKRIANSFAPDRQPVAPPR